MNENNEMNGAKMVFGLMIPSEMFFFFHFLFKMNALHITHIFRFQDAAFLDTNSTMITMCKYSYKYKVFRISVIAAP